MTLKATATAARAPPVTATAAPRALQASRLVPGRMALITRRGREARAGAGKRTGGRGGGRGGQPPPQGGKKGRGEETPKRGGWGETGPAPRSRRPRQRDGDGNRQ